MNNDLIRRDAQGTIVDYTTSDGGDSLNREGQFACLIGAWNSNLYNLVVWCKFPVRNKFQPPAWDNPLNVTRDQLTPFVCGLHLAEPQHSLFCRSVKEALSLGAPFAPNVERDVPGSTKYPYPHWFKNDRGEREFRWFDHADLLGSPLRYLIACLDGGGSKHPIKRAMAKASLLFSVVYKCLVSSHSKSYGGDDWQLLCLCLAIEPKFVKLYKRLHPNYIAAIDLYWCGWRQEFGFAKLWRDKLEAIK